MQSNNQGGAASAVAMNSTVRPMGNARLMMGVLFEPRSAFRSLDAQPTFWLPILLIVLGSALMVLWYFGVYDATWFANYTIERTSEGAQMTEDQKAQIAKMLTRETLMWSSLAGVIVTIPLIRLVEATYYLLAGRMLGVPRSFTHWLALAGWSSLPGLLSLAASLVFLGLHPNGQVTQEQLGVLGLAELFGVPDSNRWYTMLSSMTVLHPWMLWLAALGFHVWSRRPMLSCLGIAVLPWAAIYGVWALVVVSS